MPYSPTVSLKISHPLAPWLLTLMVVTFGGLGLAAISVQWLRDGSGVVLGLWCWLGLVIYALGCGAFAYLTYARRFQRLPAGAVNRQRLAAFIQSHPDIARQLDMSRYCRMNVTYGDLKVLQSQANRALLRVASRTLLRRG